MATTTWIVDVTVRLGPPVAHPGLGDRLVSELTAISADFGPVVAQDTVAGTVSAVLTVTGPDDDPDRALAAGRTAVRVALESLGLVGDEIALSITADTEADTAVDVTTAG